MDYETKGFYHSKIFIGCMVGEINGGKSVYIYAIFFIHIQIFYKNIS